MYFVACDVLTMKSVVSWVMTPCSSERERRSSCCLFLLLSCFPNSWALKTEAIFSSETSRSPYYPELGSTCRLPHLVYSLDHSSSLKMQTLCSSETSSCPNYQVLGSACRLLLLVSWLTYSLTLKTEAIHSYETLNFSRTTRRYVPKESALRCHSCENIKPRNEHSVFFLTLPCHYLLASLCHCST
jgi:hypothetical protein